jgi:hypothetical protein
MPQLLKYALSDGGIQTLYQANTLELVQAQIVAGDPVYGYLVPSIDLSPDQLDRYEVIGVTVQSKAEIAFTVSARAFLANGAATCAITLAPFVASTILTNRVPTVLTIADPVLTLTSSVPAIFQVKLVPRPGYWAPPVIVQAVAVSTKLITISESVTCGEVLTSRRPFLTLANSDDLTLGESVTSRWPFWPVGRTETLQLGWQITVMMRWFVPTVQDPVSLTESVTVRLGATVARTDAITVGEQSPVRVPWLVPSVGETVTVGDQTPLRVPWLAPAPSELVTVGDQPTPMLPWFVPAVEDAMDVLTVVSMQLGDRLLLSELALLTDVVTIALGQTCTSLDLLTVGTPVLLLLGVTLGSTETVTVGDPVIVRLPWLAPSGTDGVLLSDSLILTKGG